MRRLLAASLVILLAAPALAQVTEDDLDRAQQRLDAAQAEANTLAASLEEAYVRQLLLDEEIGSLTSAMGRTEARLMDAQADVVDLAVQMYIGASTSVSLSVLLGSGSDTASAGLEYVRRVTGVETNSITNLKALQAELDRQSGRLDEARAEQADVAAELAVLTEQAQATFVAASADYDQLVARREAQEEERRRREAEAAAAALLAATSTTAAPATTTSTTTAESDGAGGDTTTPPETTVTTAAPPTTSPPPPQAGAQACPVAGPVSFVDTWGAPRSGGRAHQGVDMMAARGTPVAAIQDGSIGRMSNSSLGGITLWMRSTTGDTFYYAHLDSYAAGVSSGMSVSAGQIIGFVGSTGNASPQYPHLHFEYHPGGGGAVNPYPLVRGIC